MEVSTRRKPTQRQAEIIDIYRRWDPEKQTINELARDNGLTRSRIYQVLRECGIPLKVYRDMREDDVDSQATEKAMVEAARRAIRLARAGIDGTAPKEFVQAELTELERYLEELAG